MENHPEGQLNAGSYGFCSGKYAKHKNIKMNDASQ